MSGERSAPEVRPDIILKTSHITSTGTVIELYGWRGRPELSDAGETLRELGVCGVDLGAASLVVANSAARLDLTLADGELSRPLSTQRGASIAVAADELGRDIAAFDREISQWSDRRMGWETPQ